MAKNNKKCALCGTAYKYCSNCDDFLKYPNWKGIFCCEECFNIYQTMSDFENDKVDKPTAKAILMKYQPSGKYKNYQNSFAASYAKIMNEDNEEIKKNAEEPMEKTEAEIEEIKEGISQSLAQQTASEVKANIISEAKKTYPKAVAHKHGK